MSFSDTKKPFFACPPHFTKTTPRKTRAFAIRPKCFRGADEPGAGPICVARWNESSDSERNIRFAHLRRGKKKECKRIQWLDSKSKRHVGVGPDPGTAVIVSHVGHTQAHAARLFLRCTRMKQTNQALRVPLSVHLWRSSSPPSDADVEVLLEGGRSLLLHACLLRHASPFFEAALRFRRQADGEGPMRIDCTGDDPRWVSAIIERAYCGPGADDVAYPVDEFIDAVRTCGRYLVRLPEHMRLAPLSTDYRVHNTRKMVFSPNTYHYHQHAQDNERPVAADGSLDAASIDDINALIGVPVVRSMRFVWCNYYAPNDEADYEDLVVVVNGVEFNTGRHYTSSPPSVSIHNVIEAAIKRFCAHEGSETVP